MEKQTLSIKKSISAKEKFTAMGIVFTKELFIIQESFKTINTKTNGPANGNPFDRTVFLCAGIVKHGNKLKGESVYEKGKKQEANTGGWK